MNINEVLKNQMAIGDWINSAFDRFKNAPDTRKNMDYAQAKIKSLQDEWDLFATNNCLLHESNEIDSSHEYFSFNYYQTTQAVYSQYLTELKQLLGTFEKETASGGAIPKEPVTKNPSWKNNPELNPTSRINLDKIFKSASLQNLSRMKGFGAQKDDENSSNSFVAMISSLKDGLTAYDNLLHQQGSESERKIVRKVLIKKWDWIQEEARKYPDFDMKEYFEAEGDMLPLMIEASREATNESVQNRTIITNQGYSAKIPKLSVPSFNGDYTKWTSFKELFGKMIGSRLDLDDAEKLAYLQGQLSGEPTKVIGSLPLINASYDTAWRLLNQRFSNEHVLITELLDKITKVPTMKKYSSESMKSVLDDINESVNNFLNMGFALNEELNVILYYVVEQKVDRPTMFLYENSLVTPSARRKYEDLLKFLNTRVQSRSKNTSNNEKDTQHKKEPRKEYRKPYYGNTSTVLTTFQDGKQKSTKCGCNTDHKINSCPKFIALSPEKRYKFIMNLKLCKNCLREGHRANDCKSMPCQKCKRKHNTMLHIDQRSAKALIGSAVENDDFDHVFLATVIIDIMDKNGAPIRARALLDSGSQLNLMTEKLCKKLGLHHNPTSMKVSGIGAAKAESKKRVNILIKSRKSGYEANMEVFVLTQVTSCQPSSKIETKDWSIPKNVPLADPEFNIPAPVDIIIGGELFYKLMSIGLISIGQNLPDLQNTVFGWVVIGKLLGLKQSEAFVGVLTQESLDKQLSRFWEIEEKYKPAAAMTQLELDCEKYFEENTIREIGTGKFITKLQFTKEPSVLGNSEHQAVRRFLHLEKKFARDPEMKKDYVKFMREYENLEHMERVEKTSIDNSNYFIPHHAVRNPSSSTTKFRVVFDGSAKTTSNVSLNEILANGPNLQEDLFSIMARFRTHQFVFSADITKMYRQIMVDRNHWKWQMIVWRENPEQSLRYYQLKTLTYGTTCASYLAIKSLQTLADQNMEKYPLAGTIAKRDFNVDDVMTGSNDLYEAIKMQDQLIHLCREADFHLHKWCANHPALLETVPKSKQEVSLDFNAEKTETKALGMKWIPKTDIFMMSYKPTEHKRVTKRSILSETAQLFDPLGLVNPVIVLAKIFLQELWALKLDWDAALPMSMHTKWINFKQELFKLNEVKISRRLIIEDAIDIQLHAFSDASTRAYGSVFYLRSKNAKGDTEVNLVCSKSRVAPVSLLTIPRLELCGALIAVEMAAKLNKILKVCISSITYWTDSELVLSWIHTDALYKVFVANRVAKIKRKTEVDHWKYIETKQNPADLVSRGILPEKLINSDLWWHGPEFLRKEIAFWPLIKPALVRDLSEERTIKTVLAVIQEEPHFIERINHRNSIKVLQRIVSYILRFQPKRDGSTKKEFSLRLSVEELKTAMKIIVKYAQECCFSEEMELIKKGNSHKSKFSNLVPIIDSEGILRVGGRLQAANIPFDQKHPALLPKDHYITKLIMEGIHQDNMHAGAQALLAITRQKYWPENGKRLSQSIVKHCVRCVRSKPILMEQIMGNLPVERVNMARPFVNVCLDFCGPFTIHHKIRGKQPSKAYVCVFVCLATKAVHLEPASDLSIDGFIRCLKRFIALRGLPKRINSDNATNLRGLYNQLTELTNMLNDESSQQKVIRYCQDHHIEWKFSPPRSPHFNGLAEAAVKSAKWHLKKVLHSMEITYDELGTIIAEIEAILNSRPLTPMSNDPNDLQPLTAGHFLIGLPLNCIDDSEVPYTSKTKIWHKMVNLRNEFWDRWSKEYMAELQYRAKWTVERENIKKGSLVVIHEDNIAPLKWKMGRVINVIHDKNGKVRVVELHTSTSDTSKAIEKGTGKINLDKIKTRYIILKRAIHRICPLPVEKDEEKEENDNPVIEKIEKLQNIKKSKTDRKVHVADEEVDPEPEAIDTEKEADIEVEEEPIARRTRARNLKASSNILVMAISILAIVIGAFGKQCKYTKFETNPGLYFESMEKMSLTNDQWNIICVSELSRYWEQIGTIGLLLDRLDKLCKDIEPHEYCDVTRKQLRLQMNAINARNEFIRGFSKESLIRKRRGFFDENKIIKEATHSMVNSAVKQGWNLIKEKVLLRVRRGWANWIGYGLKTVGGVMDDDDAIKIQEQVNSLNETYQYAMKLISNQTSIQDITGNIIKREEIFVQKQLHRLELELESVKGSNVINVKELFNMLSVQTLALITSHKESQNAIVDVITQVHHGKVSTVLITPAQLKEHLLIATRNISKEIMIPGGEDLGNMARIYSILESKILITKKQIIIKITLPLIHREFYDLFHIIPIPFQHRENKMHIIKTTEQYIGVNKKLDRYYMLTTEQKANCKAFNDKLIICDQTHMLFNTHNGMANCEMAIFTHPSRFISPRCRIKEIEPKQVWSKLNKPNLFLFTVPEVSTFNIICENKMETCTASNSGIISLNRKCIIQTKDIEIAATNAFGSDMPIILVPEINITDVVKELDLRITTPEIQYEAFTIDPEIEKMEEAIHIQKLSEKIATTLPTFSWHDAHHYFTTYLILVMVGGVILIYWYRKAQKKPKLQENIAPTPSQRTVMVPIKEEVSFK